MKIKSHIPNILTLLNLFSGIIAVFFAVKDQLVLAAFFVFIGIFFDFFDGFAARILKVQGELGKQLDSLADVVTSGVVPGFVMFQLMLRSSSSANWSSSNDAVEQISLSTILTSNYAVASIGFLIAIAAAYRLAKFNIDERQTSSFIGLPTPASAMVVLSLPLIIAYTNNQIAIDLIGNLWFLIGLTLLLCFLMNAEIPLFSLKFKDYSWKNNKVKFIFIGVTMLLLAVLQFIAIPFIIVLYVLISMVAKKEIND
ncbi:phosphatidylcholine/phosphatidylserine synthase [Lutibacter sp.]|uniref:CDP-alcohol phosphatidyltransferase family protein n=1 Tax=Lutibacter sp. TaxID=1925666 RepID=UPI0027363EAE|nr:CDP-alcohol phosphatidyltransferase family protein [Lutibacter sp.]MDP3312614.1 CDP-alcohol phosphatidyltransferase family protein [Lutibacter sp.]